MRDAILLQQAYTPDIEHSGFFYDMLRITMQRHAAYTRAWKMDFQLYFGDYVPDMDVMTGAWHKVVMIRDALAKGYEYVFWLDTDAAICDFNVDLRSAFTGEGDIGACEHDANGIPAHLNVGVLFVRNSDKTREFVDEWLATYPGDDRWFEQGSFNDLVKKHQGVVFKMDDRFNATVNVNEVNRPVVKGWHGLMPRPRFEAMKKFFWQDHIKYRV